MNAILYRWFGLLGFERRWVDGRETGLPTGIRFRWLELNWNRLGLAFQIHLWGDEPHYSLHIHLLFLSMFLKLPIKPEREVPDGEMSLAWGFTVFGRSVHLNRGSRCKIVDFPWAWKWYNTWVLGYNGHWVTRAEHWYFDWKKVTIYPANAFVFGHEVGHFHMEDPAPDGRWFGIYHYTYTLRSGEVQNRLAAIWVGRWEWRWKGLFRLRFPRRRQDDIEIHFNRGVGEGDGTWKGGCYGCSYTMKRGETPEQCLRRMEAERKFGR